MTSLAETIEGRVDLRLTVNRGAVAAVSIRSTRQIRAAGLLLGRPPQQAIDALPLLFAICGTAQRHAALGACEQALGLVAPPAQGMARRLLLLAETVREHAWRVLLDWPPLIGLPPDPQSLRVVRGEVSRLGGALYPTHDASWLGGGALHPDHTAIGQAIDHLSRQIGQAVLGEASEPAHQGDPVVWADAAAFERWCLAGATPAARLLGDVLEQGWAGFGRNAVKDLPPFDEIALDRVLDRDTHDAYAAAPTWEGEPALTGPATRPGESGPIPALRDRYGNGLLPLLAARLVELVAAPARMRALLAELGDDPGRPAVPDGSGSGLAAVEMARGRLVHRVVLEAGRISRYQIVAPTEWNFHPAGAAALGLVGAPADPPDHLARQVRLWTTALDPCVTCMISIERVSAGA